MKGYKLVYGVGIKDDKYPVFIDGKLTQCASRWYHMLKNGLCITIKKDRLH
jgi:hypothetical protein